MGFLKNIFKGVKKKIFEPLGRFAKRNKKALITAAVLGTMIYTGGALAGWWGSGLTGAGSGAVSATAAETALGGSLTGQFAAPAALQSTVPTINIATKAGLTTQLAKAGAASKFLAGAGQTVASLGSEQALGLAEVAATGEDPFRPTEIVVGSGPAARLQAGRHARGGYGFA